MSATKYMRPMSFKELIRSTIQIYKKTVWPLWVFVILVYLFLDFVFIYLTAGEEKLTELLLTIFILLPIFFIGPSMLIISNIILERPKKTFASFRKGMSIGMIVKTALYFSPVLAVILILGIFGLIGAYYAELFLLFTVPLLLFAPVWVFYPMIMLLEKKSVLESTRRIRTFISGQFKRLLQIQVLLTILTGLLTPFGVIIYQTFYDLPPLSYYLEDVILSGFAYEEIAFLADLIGGGIYYSIPLVLGIGIILFVLHYYQVRVLKENFSEELLTQELGYEPMEEMMSV